MVYTIIAHLYTQPGKEAEMKNVLVEAARIFSKDKGTIAWFVMQDEKDPTAWATVERYENEGVSSTPMPHANPHYAMLQKLVGPWLDSERPMRIHRHNELDASAK
ncbi:hypothetical protein K438DRAFT_1808020 [Mycena galopus ATCC 62051]|nr:hypothetical protein K438DRAFT_1808020 [Mycena galopus ATCC 62051]